jgi:hypothetical protein
LGLAEKYPGGLAKSHNNRYTKINIGTTRIDMVASGPGRPSAAGGPPVRFFHRLPIPGECMAQEVANFNAIVAYLVSLKIEESEAIHIAEQFMDAQNIQFDADGNFQAISIDYDAGGKQIHRA